MKWLNIFILCIVVLWLCGCSRQQEQTTSALPSPAKLESQLPRLTKSKQGEVYMSWVESKKDSALLFYAKFMENEWSESQQISQGNNWFVNWADYPALMVNDSLMAAHWLEKRDIGTYDYDINISLSKEGKTWGAPFIAHKDGISAEHGFVSLLPFNQDQLFATWLDGRNTKLSEHDHAQMEHSGAMTLRAGVFDSNGNTINEWELDKMTCDCCQTAAAITPNGPVVVYRDRSENEIRDIFITRFKDNQWTTPIPVHNDLWQIAGCPVNGPAVITSSDQLAVVWYSGSRQVPKVQMALSQDWGQSFGSPIVLSEGNTLGRVGITSLKDGTFVVSRLETQGDKAVIKLSQINKQGVIIQSKNVVQTSIQRASGFPSITSKGNEVLLAWTDVNTNSQVKLKSITF